MPELNRRGLTVSTLKHAHHDFDVDQPGKDSFRHRAAGAREVLVASANRVALMRELRGDREPQLAELLGMLAPVDLVIVEGFKREAHAKIEIHRAGIGKPALYPSDADIVALISDLGDPPPSIPHAHIDDVAGAADLLVAHAEPLESVVEKLVRTKLRQAAI